MDFRLLKIRIAFLVFSVLPNDIQSIILNTRKMVNSGQLTPLGTLCKQESSVNWIPLFLSLAAPLRIVAFSVRNLT